MVLVPYIKTANGIKYFCNNKYQSLNYYEFPSTKLSYSDIPTIKNKINEDIINL